MMRRLMILFLIMSMGSLLAACEPVQSQTASPTPDTISAAVLICSSQAGVPCSNATNTPVAIDQIAPTDTPWPYTVERTDVDEARKALEDGSAILLDVRTLGEYNKQHISGAVVIPLSELEQRHGELDAQQWIIIYCT